MQAQPSLAALVASLSAGAAAPEGDAAPHAAAAAAGGEAALSDAAPPPADAAMRGRAPDLLAREVSRRRVLCLHGFRASGEMLSLSLGPLTRSLAGTYDFTFVDAPTAASGPAEPGVPEGLLGYEWWGYLMRA